MGKNLFLKKLWRRIVEGIIDRFLLQRCQQRRTLMSLITVQVRLLIFKKIPLYALILYYYCFLNSRAWKIFHNFDILELERCCKITTDKLTIFIRDIPIEFETRSKTCFRYTYFSKNIKPVRLFGNFFSIYVYSFWKVCHPVRLFKPIRLLERSE